MRGGKRPGAGRPKIGKSPTEVKVVLPKRTVQKIDARAKKAGASRSAYIRKLLEAIVE